MNEKLKDVILKLTRAIPDEPYLRIMYRIVTGKKLNLKPPVTYNEKLQWLKLHYRNDEFTKMVDKYEVRNFIKSRVGSKYLIPLLGVWDSPDEINFELLPEKFVLKCTHDCHGLAICKDKSSFDYEKAMKDLKLALSRNYYYQGREWPYKNVKPRVICEKYMEDSTDLQLIDYKVFNFNGLPKIIQVDFDRFSEHKRKFFDTEWNCLDISFHIPSDRSKTIVKPNKLGEMLELAKVLSKGFPHLRTDFYIVNNNIYVGEMTFFHGNGMGVWTPESFDEEMGGWMDLMEVSGGKIK